MSFSEKRAVIEPLIRYAQGVGWKYLSVEEVQSLRLNNTNCILDKVFVPKIIELNPFLSQDHAYQIIKDLENLRTDVEGNMTAWQFLKGEKSLYIEKEKRERNIKLIDTQNIHRNTFHITEEFNFTNGSKTIRQDVVFFINGIPLVFVEAKAPHKENAMEEALEQVGRYHRDTPELLVVEQAFVLTHLLDFLYGATWSLGARSLYKWKDESAKTYEELVKAFFRPERIVKLITEYIFFARRESELQKVVLRPHQMRAVEKVIQRAKDPEKKRGLVWHTQGSGKTYTMIITAKRLLENPIFENPTVLMLVDRLELESQLFANLSSVGIQVEVADSKERLRKLLKEDRRGIIVSTIHRFEGMQANINTRENIFVLIDEAHRTTSGALGNYLMGALPNATFIGFTGTPIDKGRSTFVIFGRDDPPHGYLDKYSIAESIAEGTTLPLHYSFAPSDLMVDEKTLEEEFLNLKDAEGLSDVEDLDRILEKAVKLKTLLKSPSRIEEVAKYVVEHYRDYVEPLGYKAFLVVVDREACALYKQELDKHLPEEYSKVVYSPHHSDPDFMRKYHLTEEEEKRIRRAFLNPKENPKILIVTNKLLTGFDAPLLYCMYLDKPMRDHVLLQTIARVNRPYQDQEGRRKPSGLIVDFVGIFSKLEKALAFDSVDIEGVIQDIEKLKERFAKLMSLEGFDELKAILSENYLSEDKLIEIALQEYREEDKRKSFYELYKELTEIYNILSPDPFLRPYMRKMEKIIRLYRILRSYYDRKRSISNELTKKLEELVKSYTKQGEIQQATSVYEINQYILEEIKRKGESDLEKVYNLSKALRELFERERSKKPFLASLKDRLENIIEEYRRGQKSTQETLQEIEKIYEEYEESEREIAEKNMDTQLFTLYWLLKEEGFKKPEEKAQELQKAISEFPHWKRSKEQERLLKLRIVSLLYEEAGGKALDIVIKLLDNLRIYES